MDLKLLADALVIALSPVLPHLVAGGTEAVKAAGKKVPRALGAEEVAEAPEDADARAGLRPETPRERNATLRLRILSRPWEDDTAAR